MVSRVKEKCNALAGFPELTSSEAVDGLAESAPRVLLSLLWGYKGAMSSRRSGSKRQRGKKGILRMGSPRNEGGMEFAQGPRAMVGAGRIRFQEQWVRWDRAIEINKDFSSRARKKKAAKQVYLPQKEGIAEVQGRRTVNSPSVKR